MIPPERQSIDRVVRQAAESDGADADVAVHRDLEEPGGEQLPAPSIDIRLSAEQVG